MRSLAMRPACWLVMLTALSGNFAPQPSFLRKQIQPPPYSALPLMIAALPHSGQVRTDERQRYLSSQEVHEPDPAPTHTRSPVCGWRRYRLTLRW